MFQLKSLLELARQGGPLHKKHKVYLDFVGVAKVPEWQKGNPEREDLTLKLWMEMIEEDRRENAARS